MTGTKKRYAAALAFVVLGAVTMGTGCPFKAEEFQRLCTKDTDCSDGVECTDDKCTGGVCENANKKAHTICGSNEDNVCDGKGTCVECMTSADCAAHHVPLNICDLETQKCVSCSDGIKNGKETDIDCGGPDCGACLGYPCDQSQGCGNGADGKPLICAQPEGICCESACDHLCEACASAKTGKPDGTCAPIPDGSDPQGHGTCSVAGDKCSDVPNTCRCSNGKVDVGETDVDCGGPTCARCNGGKKCGGDTDCASNVPNCVNGACCNDPCEGTCYACNGTGQCVLQPQGYPDPTCPSNTACGTGGTICKGRPGFACGTSGGKCLSGVCTSGACVKGTASTPCSDGTDCVSGTCTNYLCQ